MVLKDTVGDKYCGIRYDPVQELVYGGRCALPFFYVSSFLQKQKQTQNKHKTKLN